MKKSDLIAEMAAEAKLPQSSASKLLQAFLKVVTKTLQEGESVRLIGFGTFTAVKRKATEGRNPRTGETIAIPAGYVPKFKPGKILKDAVQK